MRAFEDFRVGLELPLGPCRVSREELVAFAAEFDPQPFHLDEAAAAHSPLGGLATSGWHTCALFMRMMCDSFLLDSTSMGSPGIDTLKWVRPVRPGDTLTGTSTVLEARASKSRPGTGIVRFRHEIRNGAGKTVMWMENPILFAMRGGGPA